MNLFLAQSDPGATPSEPDAPLNPIADLESFDYTDTNQWQDLAFTYLPPVITVIVILVVAVFASAIIGRLVRRALERMKVEATLAIFISRTARWAILLLAFILCMSQFGIDTTSIAALVAGIGFAIALGFQGTLGSLAAGVLLMVFRPYKVGDTVKLDGELAKVAEIELFTTLLDTFDNRRIILPNGSVFGNKIENITFHPTRRVDVNVGVSYDADLDQTREVLKQAALEVEGRLDEPEFAVMLLDLGDSSVNWVVRVWTKGEDFWAVKDALTRLVKIKLDEAGLEIPFPQMDVHMDNKSS